MFAYCCNNPVMLIDKSGQIPDSYAGGIGEDFGELIYEWLTGEEHPSKTAEEQEVEIRQRQNKLIRDGTTALWDASMRWYNIQQQSQLQNGATLLEGAKYFIAHPKRAETMLRDMAATSTAVATAVSIALAGGPTSAVIAAIVAVGIAVWDVCWTIGEIISDIQ